MLNDVPADTRLAYLLGPPLARSQRPDSARKTGPMVVLGAATLLLLFFLWHLPSVRGH
jgi:hypothetical protein